MQRPRARQQTKWRTGMSSRRRLVPLSDDDLVFKFVVRAIKPPASPFLTG